MMKKTIIDPDVAIAKERRDRMPNWEWDRVRRTVLDRDGGACVECGAVATDVDHILPVSLGGSDDSENLQSLCNDCHKRKTIQDNEKARRLRKMRKYKRRIGGFD